MAIEENKDIWAEAGEQYAQPLIENVRAVWLEINSYYAQTLGLEIKAIWPETDVYYLQPIAQAPICIPIIIAILFIIYFVIETVRLVKENKDNFPIHMNILLISSMNIVLLIKAFWLLVFVLFIILDRAMPPNHSYIFETPESAFNGLNYVLSLIPENYRPGISFQEKYYPSMLLMGSSVFFIGMSITYFGAKALHLPQGSIAYVAQEWRPVSNFFSKLFRNFFVWPLSVIVRIVNNKNQNYYDDF